MLLLLKVPNEASTIFNLAKLGVAVGPGSNCYPFEIESGHVRVATSLLPDDRHQIDLLADRIADAQSRSLREELD